MSAAPFSSYDSAIAVPFISQWEGFRDEAYLCPAQVWTIGFGHTGDVHPGDRITREQAERLLATDLSLTARGFAPSIKVDVTANQFIALLSLAFNIGVRGVAYECPKLMTAVNAGDVAGAAREFLDINRANGKVLAGLTARRQAEAQLYAEAAS